MTYVAPNAAAANNMRSRLKRRLREGKPISPDYQAWLDRNPGQGPVTAMPRVEPARAPAPAPVPPTPSSSPPPAPGAMHVIDFGDSSESLAPHEPQAPKVCAINGCSHTPREHKIQRCGITGERYYRTFPPNASKAAANAAFAIVGFFIAMGRGLDEAPDPTESELADGAEAVTDIVGQYFPELGEYGNLLAGGYALSAYTIRAANTPVKRRT